jgi:hypothetical protein
VICRINFPGVARQMVMAAIRLVARRAGEEVQPNLCNSPGAAIELHSVEANEAASPPAVTLPTRAPGPGRAGSPGSSDGKGLAEGFPTLTNERSRLMAADAQLL